MITQEQLAALQAKWDIDMYPTFREPLCNDCGRVCRKVWHLWLEHDGWKKEGHVCEKCGKKYGLHRA